MTWEPALQKLDFNVHQPMKAQWRVSIYVHVCE